MATAPAQAFYPGRAPIDAYGNGGFRFAGMSHRGSLLCMPDGIHAWDVADESELTLATMTPICDALAPPAFLLLGTGATQVFPAPAVRRYFQDAWIGFEVMDTGAACRTFNVLLAEARPVAAALIAVA